MTPTSQIESEYSSATRVSILARLVPLVALCIPLAGEALCAVLLLRVLEAMRNAEAAGVAAVAGGMAEANLPATVAMYFALFIGFIGIVVMAIRALTVTTTASPSGWFFALAGLLTLVPLAFLWAAQSFFLEGLRGGNISFAAPNIILFLRLAIGACAVFAPLLMVTALIPLPSAFRAKNKWAPVILLVLIAIAMMGTAAAFQTRTSWLYQARAAEQLDF